MMAPSVHFFDNIVLMLFSVSLCIMYLDNYNGNYNYYNYRIFIEFCDFFL